MGLRRLVNDLSYRMYDRMRHREAFRAAADAPGEATDFSSLRGRKYAVLVTHRRDGTPVPTPVWFAIDDERRLFVHTEERTAKVKRIRRDPRVKVFASDARGKPAGPAIEGVARVLPPDDTQRAEAALSRAYGLERRLYDRVLMHGQAAAYIEVTPAGRAP